MIQTSGPRQWNTKAQPIILWSKGNRNHNEKIVLRSYQRSIIAHTLTNQEVVIRQIFWERVHQLRLHSIWRWTDTLEQSEAHTAPLPATFQAWFSNLTARTIFCFIWTKILCLSEMTILLYYFSIAACNKLP